jgi:hypothetical protein
MVQKLNFHFVKKPENEATAKSADRMSDPNSSYSTQRNKDKAQHQVHIKQYGHVRR